ncbi:alkylglycerol monooxygenase-like [Anneissia japonica]|uniref:alkylglycerol monooxygenase-like n=1 Tax=Anneissia japonica TaxID=1529436 RepID=UPI00142582D3|nr:alkylglycerol monooxygenase-like [Anneissia japonica]XP_033099681.1 alkylglycerol monooxygenase-like [Anneissia japonica]
MDQVFKVDPVTQLRRFAYLVTPNESSFETLEEVPDYIVESLPYFTISVILEAVIIGIRDKKWLRVNDTVSSISAGLLMTAVKTLFKSLEILAYIWVYENYRIFELPWNSAWTWVICMLTFDFAYYWFHRAAHEVNVLWAAHQVHHSSEEYNLSTALRQSVVQHYTSWIFYVPMALAIPTPVMLVHAQFNLLYQFWIHTELVSSLGPLEYILNTPSHHRVHHGRNPYCIDKNYAGTLIIWDRMFGTFQAEGEKVVYGLTHPLNSWNPVWIQVCHFTHILKTVWTTPGFGNKLSVIFKGPGWMPGTPRLGNPEDIPKVSAPVEVYNPAMSVWLQLYVAFHYFVNQAVFTLYLDNHQYMGYVIGLACCLYVVYTLTCIGSICDNKWYAPFIEIARCILVVGFDMIYLSNKSVPELSFLPSSLRNGIHAGSVVFWLLFLTLSKTEKIKDS